VRVIVLCGAADTFANGIHLNVIEAAHNPAEESWRNIHAIDDLVEAILTTTDRLTVAALAGSAAAGGLMLALAADEVWCRTGVVLNPHYQLMGLHGSEYWTYTLPRRVGAQYAAELTQACLPVSPVSAVRCGLIDRVITSDSAGYRQQVAALAEKLAHSPDYQSRLAAKARRLAEIATTQPLDSYRQAELAVMSRNFCGPDEPYPRLRRAFVYKQKPAQTPLHLARHRTATTQPVHPNEDVLTGPSVATRHSVAAPGVTGPGEVEYARRGTNSEPSTQKAIHAGARR
jgi:putative two-component system hydrogenase maturation factor HypX/HoxX